MPIRAFVSYKRSEQHLDERVAHFHQSLRGELVYLDPTASVFLDTEHMGAGDVFPDVLREQVEAADVLFVLLSPAWLQSEWCREEYRLFSQKEQAQGYTPRILPVHWVETPHSLNLVGDDIAEALSRVNYQEFERLRHFQHDNPDYSAVLAKLAKRVKLIAERPKPKVNGNDGESAVGDAADLNRDYWWARLEQPVKEFLQAKEQLCATLTDSLQILNIAAEGEELTTEGLVVAFRGLDGESLVEVLDESFHALCRRAQTPSIKVLGSLAEMLLPLVAESSADVTGIRQHRPCEDRPAVSVSAFGPVGVEVTMAMVEEQTPVFQRTGEKLRATHDMSPDVEGGMDELGEQQIKDQFEVIKHRVLPKGDGVSAAGVTLSKQDTVRTGESLNKQLGRRQRRSGRTAYTRYVLNQGDESGSALRRLYELLPSLRLLVVNPDVQNDEFDRYETIAQIILASKSEEPCRNIEDESSRVFV